MNSHIQRFSGFLASALILALTPLASAATNPCPPGQVPIAQVVRNLAAQGVTLPASSSGCAVQQAIDSPILSGGCSDPAVAKEYLKTRTGNKASIDGLTPEFACKLMKFIQAAPGNIGISVGTYVVTASVATHGVAYCTHYQCKEGSNTHPLGCAADLTYQGVKIASPGACQADVSCSWAHKNAPSMGLQFRLMPGHPRFPGYTEPWHIELEGGDLTRCGGSVAGAGVNTGTGPGATSSAAPSSGLANALRTILAPQPAMPIPPPLPPQPLPMQQSPLNSFSPTPAPTAVSPDTQPTNASEKSVADQLDDLTKGTPASTAATSGPSVPIVVSGTDVHTVVSSQTPDAPQTTSLGGSPIQQTFTTQDLAEQGAANAPQSAFAATLASLRTTLLQMLTYLKPFGGQTGDPLENQ